jgi:alkylated DNA nucleotide flippase Atl1
VAAGDPTPFAESVLDAVARIPRGRVMSYGDVAEFVGAGGARAVGTVLARWGSGVPWHRVVTSDGRPNPSSPERAASLLRSEGVAFRRQRVDMTAARWNGR